MIDLTDNEVSYPFIGDPNILGTLIDASVDNQNPYSHYATNIVVNIIKEYPEHEKLLGQEKSMEFQQFIGNRFYDIIYSNLLILVTPDDIVVERFENTAGE